jgi:hypothetical protein
MIEPISTLIAPPEEDILPWDAFTARTLLEADRQWEACRARREGIRSRFQANNPNSRLIRSTTLTPAWAA